MSKIFDNLSFGTHFVNEYGTRYVKLNLNNSWYQNPAWYNDHTYCRCTFNCVDYNGAMFFMPFDLPVKEIPNPNLTPLPPELAFGYVEPPITGPIDVVINHPEQTDVGLDILQSVGIITTDLDNGQQTNSNNNMQTNANTVSAPNLTLREAAVNEIDELKSRGSFSIHDVTLAIRAAANGGEIALPGMEAQANDNGIKYWVDHEEVRRVMETLNNDGTLTTLGLTDVDYSGPFRVFKFAPNTLAAATPAPDPATVTTSANPSVSPMASRVKAYVSKALSDGVTVTLRKIHSALKVNGVTCKDLKAVVEGLGYTVSTGTGSNFYSTYMVS